MKTTYTIAAAVAVSIVIAVVMMAGQSTKPPASEFGPGPRMSANGLYVVTLQSSDALKPRKMLSLPFTVVDASGHAVSDATITVDGGMPQHGHGLPTRPRVTNKLGGGWFEINGLRFNMGGWWELKLTITTTAGTDTVTFNLSL